LSIRASRNTPPIVPISRPRPPNSEVPPSTTAVMEASSRPSPAVGLPTPERSVCMTPASAANVALSTITVMITRSPLIPAMRATSGSPPIAYTRRPKTVLRSAQPAATARIAKITNGVGNGPILEYMYCTTGLGTLPAGVVV
jgi:hypothetical protein